MISYTGSRQLNGKSKTNIFESGYMPSLKYAQIAFFRGTTFHPPGVSIKPAQKIEELEDYKPTAPSIIKPNDKKALEHFYNSISFKLHSVGFFVLINWKVKAVMFTGSLTGILEAEKKFKEAKKRKNKLLSSHVKAFQTPADQKLEFYKFKELLTNNTPSK